ncbi:thiolase family protein [Sporosarcina ureae]|uniref:thiolase family protein n=1 Tax=Sporosarcina ureae TaxID=1571 RepID=UPI000A17B78B|nr:thiolase family protein [Sporosarcina ureae]ARK20939.1 acetyl-CoA acetyltransferase [Sporosarcina ureae]
MNDVVIIDSVRTAIGKLGGSLGAIQANHLAAHVIETIIERTGIKKDIVEEVIFGQAKQSADESNIARYALLRAGLPTSIPGYTVHRQCGSGVQAINSAAQQIGAGLSDVIIAGGAESMSTAPYYVNDVRLGVKAGNTILKDPNTESQPGSQPTEQYGVLNMGTTAENLAEKYNITREEQDEFSLLSQTRASEAIQTRRFEEQITPYTIKNRKQTIDFKVDEHPRKTSIEKLAALKPVFKEGGTVTAGSSSGRNDGAAAILLMSAEAAKKYNLAPKARIVSQASAGCDPEVMGIGPVEATKKALKLANLEVSDLDVIELNEAFAAQALACIKELELDIAKVNPNGGAIALGHPVGATGTILITKVLHELERTGGQYGLVTLCIAGGMGIATIVENLNR